MPQLTQDAVRAALRTIKDPELHRDIVTLGLLKDIVIDGTRVALAIELTSQHSPLKETLQRQVAQALAPTGATEFHIDLSSRDQPQPPPQGGTGGKHSAGPQHSSPGQGGGTALPQVKHIIAVGAGKGGVGKSTLATNLALALHRRGHEVGLMDGDIYGPSVPTLLGLKGKAPGVVEGKIVPFHVHGLHAVTIGALVEHDKPLIWRGPMAHGAFKQLLLDNTIWPALDYLIVDLPPGTGDVPLTLCQLLPLSGAVVIATPQQLALDDAIRAVRMFQQLNTPVFGIVENMSYAVTPSGEKLDLFGQGGAKKAAESLRLPYLGELPLFPELRKNSDAGTPEANFEHPALAQALDTIATNVLAQLELRASFPAGPKLTIA